jgi:hypothetical protein
MCCTLSQLRNRLTPGTRCEYGVRADPGAQLSRLLSMAAQSGTDAEELAAEVHVLLTSPGMLCTGPDGARVMPRVLLSNAEAVQAQEERQAQLLDALLRAMPEPALRERLQSELSALQPSLPQ